MVVALSAVGALFLWTVMIGPAWFEWPRLRSEMHAMESEIRQIGALNQKKATWEKNKKDFGK